MFFGWGREAKNTVPPESYFLHSDFFTFFIFTLFHFFYIFTIFRFFHFFTFLHFYNFSEVTLVGVFFMWGDAKKFLGGGCAGLDYFLKKWGGGPDWSNCPTTNGPHRP